MAAAKIIHHPSSQKAKKWRHLSLREKNLETKGERERKRKVTRIVLFQRGTDIADSMDRC